MGSNESAKITDSYCTGLVSGGKAFVGSGSLGAGSTGNLYYMLVNEIPTTESGVLTAISYLEPGDSSVLAIEDSYNDFVGGSSGWKTARPYDSVLINRYMGKYNLRTVSGLGASVSDTCYVKTHYGDWPSPEQFFVNTPKTNG